jgi:hypothetical protein
MSSFETSWDRLGAAEGSSRRSPVSLALIFRTKALGDIVRQAQEIAEIGSIPLIAPLDGVLRRYHARRRAGGGEDQVIEVDPADRMRRCEASANVRAGSPRRPRRGGNAVPTFPVGPARFHQL